MENKKNKKKTNKNVKVSNKKINKENSENNNIVKLKTSFKSQNFIQTKKLGIFLIAVILLFVTFSLLFP